MKCPFVARLAAALGVLFLVGVLGCQRDVAPPLVEVADVEPHEVDPGDRLEIRGAGFPQGRRARVTFRGDVRRAGEPELRGATIEAEGVVVTPDRIDVFVTDAVEERFCGRGDHAAHATFVGGVEVAFASSAPGVPPLVGAKHGVTLDVRPASVRADVMESRAREGARLLAFLGVVAGAPGARGLPLEAVTPGSLADRHGLRAGDRVTELDGLRVLETADLAPASSRVVRLGLGRGDVDGEEIKAIPLVGYASERIPSELAPALVVAGLALAALILLVLPGPAPLVAMELRIASRVRRTTRTQLARALFGRGALAVVSAVASLLVSTFALGPHVIAADVDGALLLVTALALLFVAPLSLARGVTASVRVALRFALLAGVLVAALMGMVALGGAFQLTELVRSQGGAPWEYAAARSPAAAALAFVYVAALLAIARAGDVDSAPDLVDSAPASAPKAGVATAERLGILFASALGVAAFFGGWQLPGVAEPRGFALVTLSAVVFVAKCWAVAGLLLGSASLGSPWSWRDAVRFAARRLIPVLAVAVGLLVLSRHVVLPTSLEAAFGATAIAATALLAARSTWRVRAALMRPEPHASPFL